MAQARKTCFGDLGIWRRGGKLFGSFWGANPTKVFCEAMYEQTKLVFFFLLNSVNAKKWKCKGVSQVKSHKESTDKLFKDNLGKIELKMLNENEMKSTTTGKSLNILLRQRTE